MPISRSKTRSSRITVEQGQIVKVSKDANGVAKREVLTPNWTDWIDYWSVDFDFESKREIIRVQHLGTTSGRSSGPAITSLKMSGRVSEPRKTARWS